MGVCRGCIGLRAYDGLRPPKKEGYPQRAFIGLHKVYRVWGFPK